MAKAFAFIGRYQEFIFRGVTVTDYKLWWVHRERLCALLVAVLGTCEGYVVAVPIPRLVKKITSGRVSFFPRYSA
jgi:hypothetical protein